MSERITGYILLTIGILVIVWSGFSVYQVFTKATRPIELFSFSGVSIDMAQLVGSSEGLSPEQAAMLEAQKASLKPQELISSEMINESSNIAAHLILMGFLASIGYRIASLGVQLVRPVVVKLKEANPQSEASMKTS